MAGKNAKNFKSKEIVISGISGVFPNSDNMAEFKDNLFSRNDMTSYVNRWKTDENKPIKMGALKNNDRFDYSFFRLRHLHAEAMPVSLRLLLEKTFEAIVDAGYNPEQLKGKNIAVISGVSDTSMEQNTDISSQDFETSMGECKFMAANRISYWLDVHGPSFVLDVTSSSSLYAIDYAFKSIRNGSCDAAIVCVPNVCFQPPNDVYEAELLSPEGICRPFDADGNGFTRAEAVVAIFLQKKKDARRVYANIVHSKTNCDGFKEGGISAPVVKLQKDMFEQFYQEIDVDPASISFLETHGKGVQVDDITEGTSIEEFFCANRRTPLKIGSVTSNMGFAEAASGLCSLAKLIIAFESRMIPANINYKNPHPKIKGLLNGHLEVITEPTPLEGEYFAINSFGMGGANAHLLLSPHNKTKVMKDIQIDDDLPRLVAVSGRTEEALDYIFNDLEKNRKDREYIRLLHEIFSEDISGHIQRGYAILYNNKETITSKKFLSGMKRPIMFVFAGMGSQWPVMGESLMKIPIFADSIRKSSEILKTKGVDLMEVLTNNDPKIFDNILNSFVGIAAIQIALVDVLRALDVKPDKIIGHSVGELGCAYADECFTAEQTILAAYYRGLVSLETEFIHGTMAAVGKGYNDLKELVPPEIEIACHNSLTSCTISGPTDQVQEFVNELKQKNTFVREVNTSNIAYHSRYISSAAPQFINHLIKIIPEPKARSEKWICSSALEHEWNSDKIKYSSAEYHTNNLLSPVYFEESCSHIPSDAIAIEIAPHGLLNAILKRSLPQTVENIPLTLKNHDNEVEFFLNALGLMYQAGCDLKLSNLYPAVEFPVSASTPMISPLIRWQHDEQWLTRLDNLENSFSGDRNVSIDPQNELYEYVKDHVIDGRNLYPVFGYLGLIWETVAMMQNKKINAVPVIFENVRFERATSVPKNGKIRFQVIVHPGTNEFEVVENSTVVASGFVRSPETFDKETIDVMVKNEISINDNSIIDTEEFYRELKSRGYQYEGLFKKVVCVNSEGTIGKTSWCDNFITFMNTMAQIMTLRTDCGQPVVPTFVRKIIIDVNKHFETLETLGEENPAFFVNFYPNLDLLCSSGIQMCGWRTKEIIRRTPSIDIQLEELNIAPSKSDENEQWESYRRSRLQNNKNSKVNSAFCVLEKIGDLSSFKWVEDSLDLSKCNNSTGRPIVHVYFSGLNSQDIALSVGVLSPLNFMHYNRFTKGYLGIEYSGKDANGHRLMGIVRNKGIATMVETIPTYTWRVPNEMSLAEAATIPVAYTMVIWAFFFKINLQKGSSVLIHTGNGDIGQAAINICLHYKCKIFTTVDSSEKEAFVRKHFPQIPEKNICDLTKTSFEKFVLKQTNGKGVDVVLNNLTEKKLRASVRCLALGGNFLEMGKFDMTKNNPLELGHFLKDITFHSIHLDKFICSQNGITSEVSKKLQEMLDQGIIKPISRTIFQWHEVEPAFRYMTAGKHSGKVLIKIREEEKNLKTTPNLIQIQAKPRMLCKENETYVIIEHSNGFSLDLIDWLISRDARNIVLGSKFSISSGYKNYKMRQWRSYGTNVIVSDENITKESGVENILRVANSLGHTAGIFHNLMDLENDSSEHEQNIDHTTVSVGYFDRLSRKLCTDLKYFVVLSNTSRMCTNYGLDAFLKSVSKSRTTNHFPTLVIRQECAENSQISTHHFLDSLDLLSEQPNSVVVATEVVKNEIDSDVTNKVARILGIEDLENINATSPLPDLGMNYLLSEELRQLFDSEYNIFFSYKDLQYMTLEKLQKLSTENTETVKSELQSSRTNSL